MSPPPSARRPRQESPRHDFRMTTLPLRPLPPLRSAAFKGDVVARAAIAKLLAAAEKNNWNATI